MDSIKLFFWNKDINFGDFLNINVCRDIFSVTPMHSNPDTSDAVFIGSILDHYIYKKLLPTKAYKTTWNTSAIKIWGAGFIQPPRGGWRNRLKLREKFFRKAEVFAIRGDVSKKRLEKILQRDLSSIPTGDPGILASELPLIKQNPSTTKYNLGIIPNYIEKNLPIWNLLSDSIKKSIIINVQADPVIVIQSIAQCKAIISSSLHGLIVADSFHIPNARIIASNLMLGGDYKFTDYFSNFENLSRMTLDVRNNDFLLCPRKNAIIIDELIGSYNVKKEVIQDMKIRLYQSFPFLRTT